MTDIELYHRIETTIISWNIDGRKTAGFLTREIIKIIKERDEDIISDTTQSPTEGS